jgi:hypothetical protein
LVLVAAIAVAGALASCDAGKHHDQQPLGPQITIVGSNVGLQKPMPADGVVQIAFDRYLLPSTVNRQSISILDATNQPLPPSKAPVVVYDPVARTVTLGRQQGTADWLTPGLAYKVVLALPKDKDSAGIRAIDGAQLAPQQPLAKLIGPQILAIEFQVEGSAPAGDAGAGDAGAAAADGGAPPEDGLTADLPQINFCRDVFPIFFFKCSGPLCHGSSQSAAASLVLDTDVGILNTAINRVAQGANTGPIAGTPPSENRRLFGSDMPIIAVNTSRGTGSPGNSWLMYKVDLARAPQIDGGARPPLECDVPAPAGISPVYRPLAPQPRLYADDVERGILDDYVLGREMPYPVPTGGDYTTAPLTFEEREILRVWIQRGAPLASCGACRVASGTDAGPDAGEAGADAADAADQ